MYLEHAHLALITQLSFLWIKFEFRTISNIPLVERGKHLDDSINIFFRKFKNKLRPKFQSFLQYFIENHLNSASHALFSLNVIILQKVESYYKDQRRSIFKIELPQLLFEQIMLHKIETAILGGKENWWGFFWNLHVCAYYKKLFIHYLDRIEIGCS